MEDSTNSTVLILQALSFFVDFDCTNSFSQEVSVSLMN